VVRLKSSATWLDFICLEPEMSDTLKVQQAFLTQCPVDNLLKCAMDFLDVNDLATVNRNLEETARVHQQTQKPRHSVRDKKGNKK
jgi:hypothetical protein